MRKLDPIAKIIFCGGEAAPCQTLAFRVAGRLAARVRVAKAASEG